MSRRSVLLVAFLVAACSDHSPEPPAMSRSPEPTAQDGERDRVQPDPEPVLEPAVDPLAALRDELPEDLAPYTDPGLVPELLGMDVEGAVTLLTGLVRDENVGVEQRRLALKALRLLGPDALPALDALIALLQPSRELRGEAALVVAAIGPGAARALPALESWLQQSPSEGSVRAALVGLGEASAGPVTALLVDAAGTRGDLEAAATEILARIDPDATRAGLLAALGDERPSVRAVVIEVLEGYGAATAPAMPALVRMLDDADAGVRETALVALTTLELPIQGATPRLVELLEGVGDDSTTRHLLYDALGVAAEDSEDAARVLAETVARDEEWASRAAEELRAHPPAVRAALPELIQAIGAHTSVRIPAMSALWHAGAEAADAVPALIEELAADRHVLVRLAALRALAGIGPDAEAALPAIREAADGDDPRLAVLGAYTVFRITGRPEDAIAAIEPAFGSSSYEARSWSVEVLGLMGPAAAGAVPDLVALLDVDQQRGVGIVYEALLALTKIGPAARAARPALLELVHDPRMDTYQDDVCRALVAIGVPAERALALWMSVLHAHDEDVNILAAEQLGAMGAGARDALPLLRRTLRAPSWRVRRAVRAAIGRIE